MQKSNDKLVGEDPAKDKHEIEEATNVTQVDEQGVVFTLVQLLLGVRPQVDAQVCNVGCRLGVRNPLRISPTACKLKEARLVFSSDLKDVPLVTPNADLALEEGHVETLAVGWVQDVKVGHIRNVLDNFVKITGEDVCLSLQSHYVNLLIGHHFL